MSLLACDTGQDTANEEPDDSSKTCETGLLTREKKNIVALELYTRHRSTDIGAFRHVFA